MAQGTSGLNLIEAMRASAGGARGGDPDAVDPAALRRCAGWTRLFFGRDRYFELDAQGWEHLPDTASMIVSNHSGGTSIPDAWGLVVSWYQHVGFQRPLLMMGHDMVFAIKGLGEAFERVGVMRAGRVAARRALGEQGRDLLVFPGGDRDTWRPFSQRYAVRFSGRRGYARIAVEAGVPIVPVAHVGAHHTLVVLTDGEKMARRMGLPALARATIFPVHLSLPWGLAIGPCPTSRRRRPCTTGSGRRSTPTRRWSRRPPPRTSTPGCGRASRRASTSSARSAAPQSRSDAASAEGPRGPIPRTLRDLLDA